MLTLANLVLVFKVQQTHELLPQNVPALLITIMTHILHRQTVNHVSQLLVWLATIVCLVLPAQALLDKISHVFSHNAPALQGIIVI
jgi:hypothetical protein